MLRSILNKSLKQIPRNSSSTATYLLSQKPSEFDEQDMWDTAEDVRTLSYGPLHTEELVLYDQIELYLQQLCTGTGCSLEDIPEVIDDRERVREIRASSTTW